MKKRGAVYSLNRILLYLVLFILLAVIVLYVIKTKVLVGGP